MTDQTNRTVVLLIVQFTRVLTCKATYCMYLCRVICVENEILVCVQLTFSNPGII